MHLEHVLKVTIWPVDVIWPVDAIGIICAINAIDAILIGADAKPLGLSAKAQKFDYYASKNNSYMDDLYPSMNSYEAHLASPAELYLYSCVLIGLLIVVSFIWIKEPERYYKIKRKNTDEAPLIHA